MKYYHILILFILLSSCSSKPTKTFSHKRAVKEEIKKNTRELAFPVYDFDTLLSGGFRLSYKLIHGKEKLQSLRLMKGQQKIKEINKISASLPAKNLGYIGADLGDYFIFSQSYGAGNPTDIQLIEKKTGKEISKGTWVDVDTSELIVLYISNLHKENEELRLLDLKNQKEQKISDFDNCKCVQKIIFGMRGCVKIQSVNRNEVKLIVEYDGEKIVKKYNR